MDKRHIVDKLYTLVDSDIFRPNRFHVKFNRPNNEDLILSHHSIKSVTLPAVTISTIDVRRMGRGVKLPGGVTFSDTTIILYDDAKSKIRGYFTDWIQEYTGEYDNYVFDVAAKLFSNSINSNDVIGTDMEIIQMDRQFNEITKHTLRYCFPVSIGDLELSHDTNDDLSVFPVVINYAYFDYEKLI